MHSALILACLFGAIAFGGVLAGITVDRLIVQRPAFRHLGATAWVTYGKHADLGPGLVLYPVVAIAHALLTVLSAIFIVRSPDLSAAAVPAYAATLLVVIGMALTIKAAPVMLSLRRATSDATGNERAFRDFWLWSTLRGVAQVIAFAANLWSLERVCF
jgi:hypothetical protein